MPEYHHYSSANFDSAKSTRAYRILDSSRVPMSMKTLDAYAELVSVWHRLLSLQHDTLYGVFTGFPTMEYTGDLSAADAWNIRMVLLGGTARTSKLALDSALTAYYSESAALSRHITESWAQAAFLRMHPLEARRWRQVDKTRRPAAPKFQTLINRVRKAGLPSEILEMADSLFVATSEGAHPSPAFLKRVGIKHSDSGAHLEYVPEFKPSYAHSVLDWGIMATLLIVWELGNTEMQPTEWHAEFKAIEQLFGEYRTLFNGQPASQPSELGS